MTKIAGSGSASGPGSISQRYGYHLHLVLMSLCMHEDSVLFGGEVQVGQIIFMDSV
jgi:hypothetical protein